MTGRIKALHVPLLIALLVAIAQQSRADDGTARYVLWRTDYQVADLTTQFTPVYMGAFDSPTACLAAGSALEDMGKRTTGYAKRLLKEWRCLSTITGQSVRDSATR